MISLATLSKPSKAGLGLLNLLNGLQRSFTLPVFQDLEEAPEVHNMYLSFRGLSQVGQLFHSAQLECDLGKVTIFGTREWLEHICDIVLSGWRDETREALSWDVCVAYALSRLAKLSEVETGPLSVTEVGVDVEPPQDAEACVLHANIRSGDRAFPLAVQFHDCDLNRIVSQIDTGPAERRNFGEEGFGLGFVDPGFSYSMTCRPQTLEMHMLRQIEEGSIVTFDRVIDGGCLVHCTLPDIAKFEAVFSPQKELIVNRITEEGTSMVSDLSSNELEYSQPVEDTPTQHETSHDETAQSEAEPADAWNRGAHELTGIRDIENLPVVVEFCFPSQRMNLRELSALAAGSSFKVDCALEERLVVRVNGNTIGGGHLVDLDGVLGLKISDWSLAPSGTKNTNNFAVD